MSCCLYYKPPIYKEVCIMSDFPFSVQIEDSNGNYLDVHSCTTYDEAVQFINHEVEFGDVYKIYGLHPPILEEAGDYIQYRRRTDGTFDIMKVPVSI